MIKKHFVTKMKIGNPNYYCEYNELRQSPNTIAEGC